MAKEYVPAKTNNSQPQPSTSTGGPTSGGSKQSTSNAKSSGAKQNEVPAPIEEMDDFKTTPTLNQRTRTGSFYWGNPRYQWPNFPMSPIPESPEASAKVTPKQGKDSNELVHQKLQTSLQNLLGNRASQPDDEEEGKQAPSIATGAPPPPSSPSPNSMSPSNSPTFSPGQQDGSKHPGSGESSGSGSSSDSDTDNSLIWGYDPKGPKRKGPHISNASTLVLSPTSSSGSPNSDRAASPVSMNSPQSIQGK